MTAATAHIARVIADSGEVYPMEPVFQSKPAVTSSNDPAQLRQALDSTFELFVRERGITKELAAVVRDLLDGTPTEDELGRARNLLAKVQQ